MLPETFRIAGNNSVVNAVLSVALSQQYICEAHKTPDFVELRQMDNLSIQSVSAITPTPASIWSSDKFLLCEKN